MIVKMKKLTLLCPRGDLDGTLHALRGLGAVHIRHVKSPEGDDLEKARNTLKYVRRALDVLPANSDATPSGRGGYAVIEDVWKLIQEGEKLEERLEDLDHERKRIMHFGDFDPQSAQELPAAGLIVGLYKTGPKKGRPEAPADALLSELGRSKDAIYYALISNGEVEIDADPVRMPSMSLSAVEREIEELQGRLAHNQESFDSHAGDRSAVEEIVSVVEERVAYLEARAGMGFEGPVSYLQGFLPLDKVSGVEQAAAKHGWGYVIDDPADDDKPPTLIRNPRWINIIKPVFDFMGISPGYHEVDISMFFLLFLSIFFGMIVGDAGYGALFLTASLLLKKKLAQLSPMIAPLLIVMSICTIVWGALQGTYFSMEATPAVFQSLKVGWLSSNDNIMYLCFLIGAIHITIAHGWNVIRYINSLKALAQIGWICTTWFMFFVVKTMVLGAQWSNLYLILLVIGATLIALFMTPWRELKTEWFNHVMLPLDLISNFVDVVSYVRLFAVGLATYAVGNAFNGMAVGGGVDGVLAGITAALVLFLGHTLNIIMAIMSVLVHGIRLNTLEFSGHLGMEWTGEKFEPFAGKVSDEKRDEIRIGADAERADGRGVHI
jgi:V/A-type H+/Na+-transporting ATPase subunit I